MHKKLEAELVSIAHDILQMKNRNDAVALKEKAQLLYERLSVLTFVDEYINTTPNATETKEEIIAKIESVSSSDLVEEIDQVDETNVQEALVEKEEIVSVVKEEIEEEKEEVTAVIEETKEEPIVVEMEESMVIEQEEVVVESKKKLSLQEEFKDAVSVDVTTNLFTKVEEVVPKGKPSLNDTLKSNIQVGLNDRIAFVKHLFGHSQADFNRVLSQLNSFKSEQEAKSFIKKMVKPDYDWSGKEEYEERFLELVERKFL